MNDDLVHALKRLLMSFIEDTNEVSLSDIDIECEQRALSSSPICFGNAKDRSIRVFNDEETSRLTVDAIKFVKHLETMGILDPSMRETLFERLMQIDPFLIDVNEVKKALINLGRPMSPWQRERLNLLLVENPSSLH